METDRSIVINGDLGSGKSTVSVLLSERLGIRRISVGDLYRAMAAERGMTALQLNIHAELDEQIDGYVDRLQADIAAAGEQLIVDSRLAWHFFTGAVKVHLITEPTVAARRVLGRPADTVESYTSVEEALSRLAVRGESERARFLTRYGVDKARLRNYDLVCDTTTAAPEQIVAWIIDRLPTVDALGPRPACAIDPRRILPTADPDPADDGEQLTLGYARPNFFALGGHARLAAAIREGAPLVGATLAAEADEDVDGRACAHYLAASATPARVRAWESAYGVRLPDPALAAHLVTAIER